MDAWKMGVTAVDDPSLLEVALNGADTTGRLRNLSQVKLMPIEVNGISPASISADIVFAPNGPQSAKNNYQRWATLATQTASDPSQGQSDSTSKCSCEFTKPIISGGSTCGRHSANCNFQMVAR